MIAGNGNGARALDEMGAGAGGRHGGVGQAARAAVAVPMRSRKFEV